MSIFNQCKVTCPICNKENDFTLWQSVNTEYNPEMKAKVLNGQVFCFTCPECGKRSGVEFSLLYHDMEKKLMIQYAADEETVKETCKSLDEIKKQEATLENPESKEYTYRIVLSKQKLSEKICLLEKGFDDRIVELMKMIVYSQLVKNSPELNINDFFFYAKEGDKYCFAISMEGEEWGEIPFDQELYNYVKDNIFDEAKAKDDYIVDFLWASDYLNNLKENK